MLAVRIVPGIILVFVLRTELKTIGTKSNSFKHTTDNHNLTAFGCITMSRGKDDWHVDCSSRGLVFIPALPKYATSVNLSNNQLAMLFDPTSFSGMTELREIDLSDNPLQHIPVTIFSGISKLTTLYLRNSLLYKQQNLVLDSLLLGLNRLRSFSFTFKLPENRRFSPIPCSIQHKSQPFSKVDNLRIVKSLEIDSALLRWPNNDSTTIVYQTYSLQLINGVFCYYGQMTQEQFKYMPSLKTIRIENPFLTSEVSKNFVSSNAFLTELAIYGPNAPYGRAATFIYNVTESISRLKNMKTLILEGISDNIRFKFHCSELGVYNLSGLHSFTTLSLAGNSLSLNIAEECSCFPTSLNYIDLQRNCISSSEINYSVLFFNKQIEIINATDQSKCSFMTIKERLLRLHIPSKPIQYTENNTYNLQKYIFTNSTEALNFGRLVDHYPNLKYLDLSLNNKVRTTIIPHFFSSSRPALEYLDMSNCRISSIEEFSFSNLSMLEYLDLSYNVLGKMKCSLGDRLLNLKSLKEINIAYNSIYCITSYAFDGMQNIEKIDVSNNEIQKFDASLEQTKNLEYLDLSGNRLQQLSENTMEQLNNIASTKSIQLDLSDNSLLCTCDTLKFLTWVRDTKVKLIRRDYYSCTYGNGKVTTLKDLSNIIKKLNSQCLPKTAIFISVSVFVTCCLAAFCGILVYRFRWRLRYLYYKTKIKIPYKPAGREYEQIFEYDAFISYASENHEIARKGTIDQLEFVRGFRACIHERDFRPGESIAENISRGIRSSRRTMLFLSKQFLASEWCMYELNIARMEALHTGRKVILVVMLESIPSRTIPISILDIIDTFTYLEYPKTGTENDIAVFWDKCAEFVSDT